MPAARWKRDPILVAFGERVRERRHALGLSQEALGERAGLHFTYIGGIERGERNLSLLNIVKVAKALGADVSELTNGLDGTGKKRARR